MGLDHLPDRTAQQSAGTLGEERDMVRNWTASLVPSLNKSLSLVVCWAVTMPTGCRTVTDKVRSSDLLVARQWMLRGMEAGRQGDWQAAEENLKQALRMAPFDERIHLHLGRTYWHQGRTGEAVEQLQEAVRLSGENGELWVELGRMQLALGNIDQAEYAARRALRSQADRAAAHALLGDSLRARGRLEEALENFHRSLDIEPNNAAVQLAVADIYRVWGEPRRVLSTLYTISRSSLSPQQEALANYLEGVAYKQLNRTGEALRALQRGVAAERVPVEWLVELAELQWATGDTVGAEWHLRRALTQDPSHSGARSLAARIAPTLIAGREPEPGTGR